MTLSHDEELRMECLRLAVSHGGNAVAAARQFYDFVTGSDTAAILAAAKQLVNGTDKGTGYFLKSAGSPWAVTHPGLPQIRTCAINAYGSSRYGFTYLPTWLSVGVA
jgi:hypothetical protein